MLFLFDIDGTLLRQMPPAHRLAVCDAARDIYGVELGQQELGQTAGMTDTAIARRALRAAGIAEETITAGLPAFFRASAEAYERYVPADLRPYHTPHAEETLIWLAERGAALALVTGNIEPLGWRKLRAARLDHYFRCGAFGDEAEAREALPPLALARSVETFGRAFPAHSVFVVGDTPFDVACAHANGIRAIAVATGPAHGVEELRHTGAAFVLPDLAGLRELPIFA